MPSVKVANWGSSSKKRSSSPSTPLRGTSGRRSSSARSASPGRSSSPGRSVQATGGGAFTPRTTKDLQRRESKVERRRLQSNAKAYKMQMQQQKQELSHQKRLQGLEYSSQHREIYGMLPATKYALVAGGLGVGGFMLFQMFK